MKKVLIAPLDWGLGHATRCIPVIQALLARGCEVLLAGSGESLVLLKMEFPQLLSFVLPAYAPVYPSVGTMAPKIALQIPKFMAAIRLEHQRIEEIISKEKIDLIIADHRYGCWSAAIPSVFITHQYQILMPTGYRWAAALINGIHHRMINKFTRCWIPDEPGEGSLAGILSDGPNTDEAKPREYLGLLSRFKATPRGTTRFDVVCLLSGPEPQRAILERLLAHQLANSGLRYLIVRGLPSNNVAPIENGVNHVNGDELQYILSSSGVVIARSGYSTVMDLARLGTRAIFIPTPGQTEQEYLATRLMQKQIAFAAAQHAFDLDVAMNASAGYSGFKSTSGSVALLDSALARVLV